MFKNALVSVSNKAGLVDFLKPLIQSGIRIVSTGGTASYLRQNGIELTDVSEQTGFPEVMGGRVKTLHPRIHMALLARESSEDLNVLKQAELKSFDLVIVNLYPFEAVVSRGGADEEMIENIDVGGPSMLRAAGKNFARMTVLCDPKDYSWILSKNASGQGLSLEDRRHLAAKVFSHCSSYDALISQKLGIGWGEEFSISGRSFMNLRYGENPEQSGAWYRFLGNEEGLHSALVIQGKPLSYNNILDLDAATKLVKSFQLPAAVVVKHNNPCGAAQASTMFQAVDLALKSDPMSAFGGIVSVNSLVDASAARRMNEIFLECVIATDFSPEALQVFSQKKNLRVLKWPHMLNVKTDHEIRSVNGGFLVQEGQELASDPSQWKFLEEAPPAHVLDDLIFAEKVCASLKSNAIALVRNGQVLGLGMGQVNRVEAVQHAIDRMKKYHPNLQQVVMASDAFFPFSDSVERVAKHGVKWVLHPGGSIKDEEVSAVAKKLGINMVITGIRHFRH